MANAREFFRRQQLLAEQRKSERDSIKCPEHGRTSLLRETDTQYELDCGHAVLKSSQHGLAIRAVFHGAKWED